MAGDHLGQVKHLVKGIRRRGKAQDQDLGNDHRGHSPLVGESHWRCRLISEIISGVPSAQPSRSMIGASPTSVTRYVSHRVLGHRLQGPRSVPRPEKALTSSR